jgi:predicted nucleotidyltransferase
MESIIIVKGMLGGELVAHLLASQNRSADLEELTELMDLILNGSRVKKKILKERIREFETKIELIKFRSESGGDSQKGEGKKGKVHGGRVWLRRQSGY